MALCISNKSFEPREYSSSNKFFATTIFPKFLAFIGYASSNSKNIFILEVIRGSNTRFVAANAFLGFLAFV